MLRIFRRPHRFIEANRGLDLLLKARVIEHVIKGKRLLDHHQIKFIERFEKGQISK